MGTSSKPHRGPACSIRTSLPVIKRKFGVRTDIFCPKWTVTGRGLGVSAADSPEQRCSRRRHSQVELAASLRCRRQAAPLINRSGASGGTGPRRCRGSTLFAGDQPTSLSGIFRPVCRSVENPNVTDSFDAHNTLKTDEITAYQILFIGMDPVSYGRIKTLRTSAGDRRPP